jgi:site-specific recombinase XerD
MLNNLEKLLTEFLNSLQQKTSEATIKNYKFYLQRFIKWGNLSQPQEITVEKIEGFWQYLSNIRNQRGELMKTTTQNYHFIALRAFLDYLNKQGIRTLPAQQVILKKTKGDKKSAPEKTDLERLLEAPLQAKSPGIIQKRDKAILELLFSTGLKVTELASLKKNQINFFSDQLVIKKSADTTRAVSLSNQTKYWIKQYLEVRGDNIPALFIRHDKAKKKQFNKIKSENYQLTPRTIQRIVKKYTKSTGLDNNITPETLRHAYAKELASQGFDVKSIQSMLGHASTTTTKLYTRKQKNV